MIVVVVMVAAILLGSIAAYGIMSYNRTRVDGGDSILPNGNIYRYIMGNSIDMQGAHGRFHGIDIIIPKQLPHIYLDSLQGGGRHVRFVIEGSQRIQLEGDFSQYYNVFTPQKFAPVALSILSPDVMQTCKDYAAQFDIEIIGNHVRVITNKHVMNDSMLQHELLEVATKVMQEIDHRLASWLHQNSLQAVSQDLAIHPHSGFRLFNRYLSYWSLGWLCYTWMQGAGTFIGSIILFAVGDNVGPALTLMGVSLFAFIVGGTVLWHTTPYVRSRQ